MLYLGVVVKAFQEDVHLEATIAVETEVGEEMVTVAIEHRGGRGGREREKIFGGPAIFEENIPAQIPIRLLPENLQQIITRFKSLKVRSERPLRPGYGTAGTKITLRENFFALKVPFAKNRRQQSESSHLSVT